MTPSEERVYWLGFARQATLHLGLNVGGNLLAEMVRRSPNLVPDGSTYLWSLADGRYRLLKRRPSHVHASMLRSALEDIGFPNAFCRVRTNNGCGPGGYQMSPDVARALRTLIERGCEEAMELSA